MCGVRVLREVTKWWWRLKEPFILEVEGAEYSDSVRRRRRR